MGKVLERHNKLSPVELLAIIGAGFVVSYEKGNLSQIFRDGMCMHDLTDKYTQCEGGVFLVREPKKTN
jgi:hypothetical protein